MTDRIEAAITAASSVQLRRLISLADEHPQTTEAVIPRLRDPIELAALLDEIAPNSDRLVAAVTDPATPLAELEAVYQRARELIERAQNIPQQAAAELIYHATVATAHLRYGANIATRPIEARQALYERLAGLLDQGRLADIFRSIIPSK